MNIIGFDHSLLFAVLLSAIVIGAPPNNVVLGIEEEAEHEDEEEEIRVSIGPNSVATLEVEEAEIVVITDHELPDGMYDISLKCADGTKASSDDYEVLNGYGSTEIPLEDGRYENCSVVIGDDKHQISFPPFPSFTTTLRKEMQDAENALKLDGWEHISKINQLLDESVSRYKAGDPERAKELVIEAYLYHFKSIEGDIAEGDKLLKDRLDHAINVDLQNKRSNKTDASEVESAVDVIKEDIENARTVVVPEFPLHLMSAIIAAAGILALTGANYLFKSRMTR